MDSLLDFTVSTATSMLVEEGETFYQSIIFWFYSSFLVRVNNPLRLNSVGTPDGGRMVDLERRPSNVSRISGRGQVFHLVIVHK